MNTRSFRAVSVVPLIWLLSALLTGHVAAAPSVHPLLDNPQLPADLYPQLIHAVQRDAPQDYAVTPGKPAAAKESGRITVYQAHNPTHRLSIEFNVDQVAVYPQGKSDGAVRMRLDAYGYGKALKSLQSVERIIKTNRVEFRRGSDRDASPDIIEWYVNGPLGLEQGFTLAKRPPKASGTQHLMLSLALSGELKPVMTQEPEELVFRDAAGRTALRYGALYVYDARDQKLPAHFALADKELRILIDDTAALYPVTVDPFFFIEQEHNSDNPLEEAFGIAVAFNQEEPFHFAVGVSLSNAVDTGYGGAVYTFRRGSLGNWVQEARITNSGGHAGDGFGRSVALSGTILVVGAPFWDCIPDLDDNCGAAYIFQRSFDTWSQVVELYAPNAGPGRACGDCEYNFFGQSVAISNLSSSAFSDERHVVVGAPIFNQYASVRAPGKAYVFRRNVLDIWERQAELAASDFDNTTDPSGDLFGHSVGINHDTVVVGAPWKTNTGGTFAGAVYVYVLNVTGTAWSEQAIITANDAETNDLFGNDVAINRDDTIVVGVPRKQDLTGAAYVFRRGGPLDDSWSQEARLTASDGEIGDSFGKSVAISGDNIVVGAPAEDGPDNLYPQAGAAYFFQRSTQDIWSEFNKVTASDRRHDDPALFGSDVGISGVNLVVGAPRHDHPLVIPSGGAYVYEPLRPDPETCMILGDMDGNGQDDLVVDFTTPFSTGLFVKKNLGPWKQMHSFSIGGMAAGDLDGSGKDDIVINFGFIALWARMNDILWLKLHNDEPENVVVADIDGNGQGDVIGQFRGGIFVKPNLGFWSQLHGLQPEIMAVGDLDGNGQDDLIVDFGAIGLWVRMSLNSQTLPFPGAIAGLDMFAWRQLHNKSPDRLAIGDLDGNGRDDVLAAFGSSVGGFWVKQNLGAWSKLNNNAPDQVAAGDLDGNGQDDVIADFGSSVGGLFVKSNLGPWQKLHNSSLTDCTIAVGDMDGNSKDDFVVTLRDVPGLWGRMNGGTWLKLSNTTPVP